jgi:hypothetical protein
MAKYNSAPSEISNSLTACPATSATNFWLPQDNSTPTWLPAVNVSNTVHLNKFRARMAFKENHTLGGDFKKRPAPGLKVKNSEIILI